MTKFVLIMYITFADFMYSWRLKSYARLHNFIPKRIYYK